MKFGCESEAASPAALGIYVHLPFCRVRCSYCPFAISTDHLLEDRYVTALLDELRMRKESGAIIESLYFGGGTPSRTSIANLGRIFELLRSQYSFDSLAEVTLEANPEDVSAETLDAWRRLGVNRLSIGVQSFHDRELLPLGRVHGREGAIEALDLVSRSGFRFSLDLIGGLPLQTDESFFESLAMAVDSGAGHLSVYLLDLEEGTALERQVATGRIAIPDDELQRAIYLGTIDTLRKQGLEQYEISSFARDGERSRHNQRYWSRKDYLGVGVGAHSLLRGSRIANLRDTSNYISVLEQRILPVDLKEILGPREIRRETIFLALRQTSGLRYPDLVALCGKEGEEWAARGMHEGWLTDRDGSVAFSPAGFVLSSEYISQLF